MDRDRGDVVGREPRRGTRAARRGGSGRRRHAAGLSVNTWIADAPISAARSAALTMPSPSGRWAPIRRPFASIGRRVSGGRARGSRPRLAAHGRGDLLAGLRALVDQTPAADRGEAGQPARGRGVARGRAAPAPAHDPASPGGPGRGGARRGAHGHARGCSARGWTGWGSWAGRSRRWRRRRPVGRSVTRASGRTMASRSTPRSPAWTSHATRRRPCAPTSSTAGSRRSRPRARSATS